jgi:hypothetical protein
MVSPTVLRSGPYRFFFFATDHFGDQGQSRLADQVPVEKTMVGGKFVWDQQA